MNKKLYRSTKDSQFTGVCGGLSETFNIDVSLLRILVVAGGFFTGGGVWLVYLIAAMIMPTDKDFAKKDNVINMEESKENKENK